MASPYHSTTLSLPTTLLYIFMNEIQKYISENEPKMLEDLFSLIRIPSISAKPEHHDDMLACAERWAQLLIEAGADEALVMPSKVIRLFSDRRQ